LHFKSKWIGRGDYKQKDGQEQQMSILAPWQRRIKQQRSTSCLRTSPLKNARRAADLLLQLEGEKTKNIVIEKSEVQTVKRISTSAPGVSADAFAQKP
jgi:hypothetical protein